MHQDFGPRRTGRTTKMLLKVAHALTHGEQVLVIVQNHRMIFDLSRRLNAIFADSLSHCTHDILILNDTGGTAYFACPESLERVVKGLAFNTFFSDPGELEDHELQLIAPHIRLQVHQATEQQVEFDFDLAAFDAEEPPPKENRASRRTFTSR